MMGLNSLLSVVIACCLFSCVQLSNKRSAHVKANRGRPGTKVRITRRGLDYASDVGLNFMMVELTKLKIPDVEQTMASTIVSIKNMQMVTFDRPQSRIIPMTNVGVRLELSKINFVMTADFNATTDLWFTTVNNIGNMTINGKNMFVKLDFILRNESIANESFIFEMNCTAGGQLQLQFMGDFSEALNIGSRVLQQSLRSQVGKQLCDKMKQEMQASNFSKDDLLVFPDSITIADQFTVFFGLTRYPEFTKLSIESFHNGTTSLVNDTRRPPFTPALMRRFDDHSTKMVYAYVTDYVVNSGLYAAFQSKKLAVRVTNDMLPEEEKGFLRCSCPFSVCIGSVFPEIGMRYPGWLAEIDIVATQQPTLSILNNGGIMRAYGDMHIHVTLPQNSTLSPKLLISLNVTLTASATFQLNKTHLMFDIGEMRSQVQVLRNTMMTPITNFMADAAVKIAREAYIIPRLRKIGRAGIALPATPHISLINAAIIHTNIQGLLVLGTDVYVRSCELIYNHICV